MKRGWALLILSLILLTQYQNCSPMEAAGKKSLFSLSSVYPYYEEKPVYYENLQLIEVSQKNSVWSYKFAAAVARTDDPARVIDVEIRIYDGVSGAVLCTSKKASVNNTNNHIEINSCNSSLKVQSVHVEMDAKLSSESVLKPLREYEFKL